MPRFSFVRPTKRPDPVPPIPLALPAPRVAPTVENVSRPRMATVLPFERPMFRPPSLDIKTPWEKAKEPSRTVTLPTLLTMESLTTEYSNLYPGRAAPNLREMLQWTYQRMKDAESDRSLLETEVNELDAKVTALEIANGGLTAQVNSLLLDNRSLQVELNVMHSQGRP